VDSGIDLGFPLWIRLTHLFNILFITLLIRSGIEILAAHPKLYLSDDCTPGTEWIRFTPREMPKDQFWTGKDEQEAYSSWVSLPGGKHLGLRPSVALSRRTRLGSHGRDLRRAVVCHA
jgi:methionine sulfoxide reductase catalytic subunit